jgi:PilZ domain
MDRRVHERHLTDVQIRVTAISSEDASASGDAFDVSESGIGVYLPLLFAPGTAVRINIADSLLFGVVTHSAPERSFFRTGIEVWQVLLGSSDLADLLKATLHEGMPTLQLETADWNLNR